MAREKHREAHKKIFTEYYRYVQTIVYNRLRSCGTAEDVEDCVSNVFAAVFIYCDNNVKYGGELKGIICGIAACLALLTGGIGVDIYLFRDNSHPHTEYSDETNIQASDITTSAVTDAVEVITQSDDEERNSLENKSYIKYMLTNCWDYFNTVQGNYERTFDGHSHTVEFCVDKTAEYKRETWSDDNIEWTDYCYDNTLYSVAEHEKRFIANYEYYGNETLGELDIRDEIIHMKFAHLVVQPFLAAILLEDFDCWEITAAA